MEPQSRCTGPVGKEGSKQHTTKLIGLQDKRETERLDYIKIKKIQNDKKP